MPKPKPSLIKSEVTLWRTTRSTIIKVPHITFQTQTFNYSAACCADEYGGVVWCIHHCYSCYWGRLRLWLGLEPPVARRPNQTPLMLSACVRFRPSRHATTVYSRRKFSCSPRGLCAGSLRRSIKQAIKPRSSLVRRHHIPSLRFYRTVLRF